MSLLREVKPRNARTARVVKAREPQQFEDRKRVLLLHGTKNPDPVRIALKTFTALTKPHSVHLNKKNENIHPFEDPASLEFLASKNDCSMVVFGTHSKKRPNSLTFLRIFDGKMLDLVELLIMTTTEELTKGGQIQIGVEMKPMMIFAGSQWDDDSASESAANFRQLKSMFIDLFQGEEIRSVEVAGLQHVLMIAAGETIGSGDINDSANKPVLHLRWYKVKTVRSSTPKIPRVELDQVGSGFDFRVGRFKLADTNVLKEAMKHGRRPNEAKSKKNIETDLMGDKLGRIHLGKQDLGQLQTRKMKALKRGREELDDDVMTNGMNGEDEDLVSQDGDDNDDEDGGMYLDDASRDEEDSSIGGTGDEIDIDSDSDSDTDINPDAKPKRQKLG